MASLQHFARSAFIALCGLVVAPATGSHAQEASTSITLPNGKTLQSVEFDRHVVPLLGRFGCNSGSCHGSFQGRGGMRLSLFGHSAQLDYDELSARVDTDEPDESLILQKPSQQLDHEGGKRFERGSWPYQVIRRWIEQGAPQSPAASQRLELKISPAELFLDDAPRRLTVLASIGDGGFADVTPFCRFSSGDEGVVQVDNDGVVRSIRPGTSHVTVEYLGQFANVLATRSMPSEEFGDSTYVTHNDVDRYINERLGQLRLASSGPASDEQFLRRVTLDVVGRLPTIKEIHHFAGNRSPDARRQVISRLLRDPRHASLWATRLCDITRCTAEQLEGPDEEKPKRAKMWHDWFETRLQQNMPYDKIVRGVLCGTSVSDQGYDSWLEQEADLVRQSRAGFEFNYSQREFLDLYWRRRVPGGGYPREQLAELTSAAFLGIQIECAQCHKHPYDRWTQQDYRSFVNVFAKVEFGTSRKLNAAILQRLQRRREMPRESRPPPLPRLREVFVTEALARPLKDIGSGAVLAPKPLGGAAMNAEDPLRTQLMDWLVGPARMQFASNFVNRVWSHYFGRGLVEPVDGFSAINPPTHPQLLEHLATEFIESGYDIRKLETTILCSATYQRDSAPEGNNARDNKFYARSYVRPLLAEVTADVIHTSLGVSIDHGGQLPEQATAIELSFDRGDSTLAKMLRTFGRGPRKSVCDCDRRREPSLPQALFQMSDPWVLESIENGVLLQQVHTMTNVQEAIDHVYLLTLARLPNEQERQTITAHVEESSARKTAWVDVIWSLLNTREFCTNR